MDDVPFAIPEPFVNPSKAMFCRGTIGGWAVDVCLTLQQIAYWQCVADRDGIPYKQDPWQAGFVFNR